MTNSTEFDTIYNYLKKKVPQSQLTTYLVPEVLVGGASPRKLVDVGNPYAYYCKVFSNIQEQSNRLEQNDNSSLLSRRDVIYQSFIRTFAALNGKIGTALTQIAFLPYLKETLGITIFVSLPTGVIGRTNRKGKRGSPFATYNPFDVDPSFGDPLLPRFSAFFQYKALIQACNKLGIRSGSILPLATLSIDSPLFAHFPQLGYWWVANPGELLFCEKESIKMTGKDNFHQSSSPEISQASKDRFVKPPTAQEVTFAVKDSQMYFVASKTAPNKTQRVTLANAFPDVAAGELNTYTWADVAPIKYVNQDYPPPMGSRNQGCFDFTQPVWKLIPYIIAWRANILKEEIFLIDVNQSFPEEVLRRANQINENWETIHHNKKPPENVDDLDYFVEFFNSLNLTINDYTMVNSNKIHRRIEFIGEELWSFESTTELVSTVVGPLVFCVSAHTHNHELFVGSLRHHFQIIEKQKINNYYFGGASNHDTMPPLPAFLRLIYLNYYFLPNCIPLVYSGVEHYAQTITNKEFGFDSTSSLLNLREHLTDGMLGLFNDVPLDWANLPRIDDNGREFPLIHTLLRQLSAIRERLIALDEMEFKFVCTQDPYCFGYIQYLRTNLEDRFILYTNWHPREAVSFMWPHEDAKVLLSVDSFEKDVVDIKYVERSDEITIPSFSATLLVTGTFREHFG